MITKTTIAFLILFMGTVNTIAQTAPCDGTLPFEEQNGLLTIEMESGIINDNRWQIGTETVDGEEITYLYWTGPESFNALTGAPIVYNIKINTPGTYRFAWRMRVGTGTAAGEHNDAWLKVDGEDFYGIKNGAKVYPKPLCNSDPALTCAAGSSTQNFIKAFGNRLDWGFVTNTNDGDSHRVWVTFNEAKVYTITLDARSNYLFIDKMVLRRSNVSDTAAQNLNNPESSCYNALSINDVNRRETKIYPNPTMGKIEISNIPINSILNISNISGAIIRTINTKKSAEIIDISDLESGLYFISNSDKNNYFVKKIIKI